MTNQLTTNPIRLDTTGATSRITSNLQIKLIQWIDDNADIADNDDLVFVIDGVTIPFKIQLNLSNPIKGVAYEANFGGKPFKCNRFSLTTMSHGQLLIWLE